MKIIEKAQQDKFTLGIFAVICFLLGIIVGFLCSPIKHGLMIASNNNITGCDDDDEDDDYSEDIVEF